MTVALQVLSDSAEIICEWKMQVNPGLPHQR
jgi:hypothetical protein